MREVDVLRSVVMARMEYRGEEGRVGDEVICEDDAVLVREVVRAIGEGLMRDVLVEVSSVVIGEVVHLSDLEQTKSLSFDCPKTSSWQYRVLDLWGEAWTEDLMRRHLSVRLE